MMKYILCGLVGLSVLFGIINGDMESVSNAVLSESTNAVTLAISLTGIICLWSGVMRVAEKAGLVNALAKLLTPILSRIFKGIDKKGKAMGYIVLNLAANILGLGNASTPFGLAAMRELEKEEGESEYASNNMVLFVIMNTASLQLIPTTVAAIRLKNGSQNPMEILPCVWIVSSLTLIITLIMTKTLEKTKRK